MGEGGQEGERERTRDRDRETEKESTHMILEAEEFHVGDSGEPMMYVPVQGGD